MTVRIVIVDDQALFRAGVAMIIGTQPDLQLVAECASGEDAIDAIARDGAVDVVLMDVQMPGVGGITATETILRLPHPPRILVLTTFDDDATTNAAIAAGAHGFVLKDARAELLLSAIRSVADGTAVVARSTPLSQPTRPSPPAVPAAFGLLTESERKVFRHAAAGMSNREIAAATFLSEATVKSYLSRILTKLALRDRVQLVLFAVRHGLVD
jgi:DNA-binding NarL/FixJ family response regulator